MKQELMKLKVNEYDSKEEFGDFDNYIEAMRYIVQEHQCLEINNSLVDVQTANVCLTVYDNLNDANKERTHFIDMRKYIDFCWKQVG